MACRGYAGAGDCPGAALPPRLGLGPRWVVPAGRLLLLAGIVIADRGFVVGRSTVGRARSVLYS